MAAFNFPSSPSNGDSHSQNGVTFTYSSASGAWQRSSAVGAQGATGSTGSTGAQGDDASLTTSVSAPGSPSAGDMWWDSDDANLYVYYNDGSSSQWVTAVSYTHLRAHET